MTLKIDNENLRRLSFVDRHRKVRAPKFSMRLVFLAAAVVAVALGIVTKQRHIASQLRKLNVRIEYRYQYDNWEDLKHYSLNSDAELSGVGELLGPDLASTIVSISSKGSQDPSKIAKLASQLPHMRMLAIVDTALNDEDLKYLVDLSELQCLCLRGTAITDASVESLSQMSHLVILDIENTNLSDDASQSLRDALPDTRLFTGPSRGGGFM